MCRMETAPPPHRAVVTPDLCCPVSCLPAHPLPGSLCGFAMLLPVWCPLALKTLPRSLYLLLFRSPIQARTPGHSFTGHRVRVRPPPLPPGGHCTRSFWSTSHTNRTQAVYTHHLGTVSGEFLSPQTLTLMHTHSHTHVHTHPHRSIWLKRVCCW